MALQQSEPNLQRMALLPAAIAIWDQPDKKERIWKICWNDSKITMDDLIKETLEETKSELLPITIKNELLRPIIKIGTKMKDWYEYIRNWYYIAPSLENLILIRPVHPHRMRVVNNIGNDHYANNIIWTHHEVIDEAKTIKSFIDKAKTVESFWSNETAKKDIYYMACFNALEEEVYYLKDKISNPSGNEIKSHCLNVIVAYWTYYRWGDNKSKSKFFEIVKAWTRHSLYNNSHSVEKNMFFLSARMGFGHAVTYFLEKAYEGDADRAYSAIKELIVFKEIAPDGGNAQSYKKEQYVMLMISLIRKVTDSSVTLKDLFLRLLNDFGWHKMYKCEDFFRRLLIHACPFENFVSLLNEMPFTDDHHHEDFEFYSELLSKISILMKYEFKFGLAIENSVNQRTLQKVWMKVPTDIKGSVARFYPFSIRKHFIGKLFKIFDISSILLIINTPEVAHIQNDVIEMANFKLRNLVQGKKFKLLDPIVEKVFVSDEEKKNFKKDLTNFEFHSTSELYCYLKNSFSEEKFEERIRLLEELWVWQGYSLEEIKLIIKNEVQNLFIEDFCDLGAFKCQEFLDWCSFSNAELELLKRKVVACDVWCFHSYMKKGYVEKVQELINWVCDDENKRKDFIQRAYMQTSKRIPNFRKSPFFSRDP